MALLLATTDGPKVGKYLRTICIHGESLSHTVFPTDRRGRLTWWTGTDLKKWPPTVVSMP